MKYHGKEMPKIHPEGCKAMTWEDAERMEKENQENGWGFSTPDLLRLIADHMDGNYMVGDGEEEKGLKMMECIEWRLEDANFHTLCGYLNERDYKKAVAYVVKEWWE